jgi:hypothetical protein
VDPDRQFASTLRRQRKQIGAALHFIEALPFGINERIGRPIIWIRGPRLIEPGRHAHYDVASEILARQLVAKRIANEIHPLGKRVVLDRQSELSRKQVGDPIFEALALGVRER